jgi:cysteine-rich repeat protein
MPRADSGAGALAAPLLAGGGGGALNFADPFATALRRPAGEAKGEGARERWRRFAETRWFRALVVVAAVLSTLLLLLILPADDSDLGLHGPEDGQVFGRMEVEKCGNGVVDHELHEQCDDGNVVSRDGCTGTERRGAQNQCQLEPPMGLNCNVSSNSSSGAPGGGEWSVVTAVYSLPACGAHALGSSPHCVRCEVQQYQAEPEPAPAPEPALEPPPPPPPPEPAGGGAPPES